MKDKTIAWLIPVIIILVLFAAIFIVKITVLDSWQEEKDVAKEKCDNIIGCEKYACYADLDYYTVRAKSNFLLREQNCILKRADKTGAKK